MASMAQLHVDVPCWSTRHALTNCGGKGKSFSCHDTWSSIRLSAQQEALALPLCGMWLIATLCQAMSYLSRSCVARC